MLTRSVSSSTSGAPAAAAAAIAASSPCSWPRPIGETSAGGGYLVDHSRAAYLISPEGKPIALAEQDRGPAAVADVIEQWVK